MTKIYALECDTENFTPDYYFSNYKAMDEFIYIGDNNDLVTLNAQLKEDVLASANVCYNIITSLSPTTNDSKKISIIKDCFSQLTVKDIKLKDEEILKLLEPIVKLSTMWLENEMKNVFICDILSVFRGEKFVSGTLLNHCSWNNYICPESKENHVKNYVKAVYFNEGKEFAIATLDSDDVTGLDEKTLIHKILYSDSLHYNYFRVSDCGTIKDVYNDLKQQILNEQQNNKVTDINDVVLILIKDVHYVKKIDYSFE